MLMLMSIADFTKLISINISGVKFNNITDLNANQNTKDANRNTKFANIDLRCFVARQFCVGNLRSKIALLYIKYQIWGVPDSTANQHIDLANDHDRKCDWGHIYYIYTYITYIYHIHITYISHKYHINITWGWGGAERRRLMSGSTFYLSFSWFSQWS